MSLKTMPEHVRHRLIMNITNVFCMLIASFYKPARHNMMQLLLCSSVCCQNVSHFGLFISFMTEKTFSTPYPWLPSYFFLQTTGGSYLRSSWHCSFWCSAFGKKNNLIPTFLPRTRSVSFPHTVTFTQWVPLPHRRYDRDLVLRQLLQLTD